MDYQFDQEFSYLAAENRVHPRLEDSPYYQTCVNAFEHDHCKVIRPYEAAFIADYNGMPLSYDVAEVNPKFLDQVYGTYAQEPEAVCAEECIVTKIIKRRGLVLALILILSLAALALPIISSLALLPEYINIGVDVLNIADIFGGELGLETITNNLPILLVAVYLLFALILVIVSLCALFIRKKKHFFVFALLALVAAVAFVLSIFGFDFNAVFEGIADLDYGIYGLVACPLLILILSCLSYKKIE